MHSSLSHRNLGLLSRTASTSRVLNLARLATLYSDDPEWKARPFFKTPYLNSAVILKHSVRGHERTLFNTVKYLSTHPSPLARRYASRCLDDRYIAS